LSSTVTFMNVPTKRSPSGVEGRIFAYELTPDRLRLLLFRRLPIAGIRIEEIHYLRQATLSEYFSRCLSVFDCHFWPTFVSREPGTPLQLFLIRTHSGRRIYLRMRSSFHYQLRSALGRNPPRQWHRHW
jgi:hypothetical protein